MIFAAFLGVTILLVCFLSMVAILTVWVGGDGDWLDEDLDF